MVDSDDLTMESLEARVLLTAGNVNPSFGGNGNGEVFLNDLGNNGQDIIQLKSGFIVQVGRTASDDFVLFGLKANGTTNAAFGTNGATVTDFKGREDQARKIFELPDGKLLVVGESVKPNKPNDDAIAVARYKSNGKIDTTFGINGEALTRAGGFEFGAFRDVVLQKDGKIVLVGGGAGHFVAVRLLAKGILDTTFGTKGVASVTIKGTHGADAANTALIASDGKIILGGSSDVSGDGGDFAFARLTSSGKIDKTFGTNGITVFDDGNGQEDIVSGMTFDLVGRIVVAGVEGDLAGTSTATLLRLKSTGKLDTTFGNGGVQFKDTGGSGAFTTVSVDSDGLIIASGVQGDENDGGLFGDTVPLLDQFQVNAKSEVSDFEPFSLFDPGATQTFNRGIRPAIQTTGDEVLDFVNGVKARIAVQPGGKILLLITTSDGTQLAQVISDGIAPIAAVKADPITKATNNYRFTVTYKDNIAVNFKTLTSANFLVTGPNGFSAKAKLMTLDKKKNGSPRVATYQVAGPGGRWDAADNGKYSIVLQVTQVSDLVGNFMATAVLKKFNVTI